MKKKENRAKEFLKVGIQYLHLSEKVSNSTFQQGNINYYISDDPISERELNKETQWSDNNLVLPLLFNFYHGLEVILKGFICIKINSIKKTHRLCELLADFNKHYPTNSLIPLFEKYIQTDNLPQILAEFCRTSSISMDDFYIALKYPEKNENFAYHHHPLKNKGEKGRYFFEELRNDIELIRKKSISLYRNEKPNA